jgi:trans-aconitate methyltransferase
MADDDRELLERVAGEQWYAQGANGASVRYLAKVLDRHWHGASCLELGPAEGLLTDLLVGRFSDLTLVDGSATYCDQARERFPHAAVVCSMFDDFTPPRTYDALVLGHILEHIDEPEALLRRALDWVSAEGRVYAAVPNARSVHRQAAVIMGLLGEEHELNETDIHHGHRQVFDPESFRGLFTRAGWRIEVFGGYWLKPLSNRQLEEQWSDEQLQAYLELGERYPDIAAELYLVASPASR